MTTTIELPVDQELKTKLERLFAQAQQEKRSRQDVLAAMIRAYNGQRFLTTLDVMHKKYRPIVERLGLKTDDDFERYLG
jgi:hemoglobin-like flavoprotein